jgi:hypothetical protein
MIYSLGRVGSGPISPSGEMASANACIISFRSDMFGMNIFSLVKKEKGSALQTHHHSGHAVRFLDRNQLRVRAAIALATDIEGAL